MGDFVRRAARLERLELEAMSGDLRDAERARLVGANERVIARLRRRVAARRFTPQGLRRALAHRVAEGTQSYDAIDWLVAGLFDGPLADGRRALAPEMVSYQPTPVRAILSLIERADIGPGDVFCDLGAGLGYVALLVALLTGARAIGVEIEPAYCDFAARAAQDLRVPGVEFVCADAREAKLDGDVFFLYTPFRGAILAGVLDRLRLEARARPLRVCTYGPCTFDVAQASWLTATEERAPSESEVAVFVSGSAE